MSSQIAQGVAAYECPDELMLWRSPKSLCACNGPQRKAPAQGHKAALEKECPTSDGEGLLEEAVVEHNVAEPREGVWSHEQSNMKAPRALGPS